MRKSGLKSNLSWDQIHNQHWGLSDALRIEPEEAWQKLVAGEDLWGSEEQDQEAAASSAPVDHAEAAESLHNPSDDGSHATQQRLDTTSRCFGRADASEIAFRAGFVGYERDTVPDPGIRYHTPIACFHKAARAFRRVEACEAA